MRIAIASSGLGHVARGVEAWAADLGRALATRNSAVTLYKGGGQAETAYERVLACCQRGAARTAELLRWLPRRALWRLRLTSGYGLEQTTFALSLLRDLRRSRADILHVQDPWLALLVQRAQQLGIVRTRTILGHGTEEPTSFLQQITYLHHLAPWHMAQARAAGAWRPTWTTIPNFIDTERFRPGRADSLRAELGIPPNALVVVTAAAINRTYKRIDHLIQEFAQLRRSRPDLPVWLVLAGARETETEELIRWGSETLGDRVRFLSPFPRSRMPELYRAADLFVLTSRFEMLAIVLLEAMATGLPAFVHKHPVLEWLVGPGGLAIDMTAPGELARAMIHYLDQPGAARQMGSLARRQCVAHFSEPAVVDQILSYYQLVLGDGRCGTPVAELQLCHTGDR